MRLLCNNLVSVHIKHGVHMQMVLYIPQSGKIRDWHVNTVGHADV
jgi:hypothetical protein